MEDSKVLQIVEAARKRFAHYGLTKTTMNEIAADIGMSKASLYYYFPDKERLFIAVVNQELGQFESVVNEIISRPSKASFKLKKYVTTRNEFLRSLLNLAKLEKINASQMANPAYNDLKVTFYQKDKLLIEQILIIGMKQLEFQKMKADTYAEVFIAALIGIRYVSLYGEFSLSSDNYEKMNQQSLLYVDLFLKSIRSVI
jgi:TetR/AcrR family transcriptional repressor of mexJK operon